MTPTEREKRIEAFIEYNRKICWEAEYQNGEYCIGENKVRKFLNNIDIGTAEHDKARNQAIDDVIKRLSIMVHYGNIDLSWSFIKEEIEQLKTKP